jgi:hypothetical protein
VRGYKRKRPLSKWFENVTMRMLLASLKKGGLKCTNPKERSELIDKTEVAILQASHSLKFQT